MYIFTEVDIKQKQKKKWSICIKCNQLIQNYHARDDNGEFSWSARVPINNEIHTVNRMCNTIVSFFNVWRNRKIQQFFFLLLFCFFFFLLTRQIPYHYHFGWCIEIVFKRWEMNNSNWSQTVICKTYEISLTFSRWSIKHEHKM